MSMVGLVAQAQMNRAQAPVQAKIKAALRSQRFAVVATRRPTVRGLVAC